jgi:hypothetical protein
MSAASDHPTNMAICRLSYHPPPHRYRGNSIYYNYHQGTADWKEPLRQDLLAVSLDTELRGLERFGAIILDDIGYVQ